MVSKLFTIFILNTYWIAHALKNWKISFELEEKLLRAEELNLKVE